MKSLRMMLLAGACGLSLAGCASTGGALQTAAQDVKNVTGTVVKTGPDAIAEIAGIGTAIVTAIGDVAQLLQIVPAAVTF